MKKAVTGFGPFISASGLADEHLAKTGSPEKAIDSLVRSEVLKVGASGFLMGLPGFLAMPFTIPANIGADYLLGARVVAAIAQLRGWNLSDPRVQSCIVLCLLGHHGKEALKNASKAATLRAAENMISAAAVKAALEIEGKVGAKMMTKTAQTGATRLTKAIPFVGGFLSAGIDASYLLVTARAAKKLFPAK